MKFTICFTNFGPYHLARLRALAASLDDRGARLIAYEVAGRERTYPWARNRNDEPFEWITLFPERDLETISTRECRRAMSNALFDDLPDALGIVGYSRPESVTALWWAKCHGRPTILMSESQSIDRPRVWWKEAVKRSRVSLFQAALVGGERHRDYLVELGMPADRVALGYNAVDNDYYSAGAERWRHDPRGRRGLPTAPFFLSVCRFVPEKNLVRLIEAFARYRDAIKSGSAWDLVLCGDGPGSEQVTAAINQSGWSPAIHRPGFLQADQLVQWYAHAGAFVLPSVSEPWGLVVNEAAAAGVPLLVSDRAGCAPTLVPDTAQVTGARFDPLDVDEITARLSWMANCSADDRRRMGRRAANTVAQWGPERFAQGTLEAIELAEERFRAVRTRRTNALQSRS